MKRYLLPLLAMLLVATPSHALNMLSAPFSYFTDSSGNPLNGCKVYTYSAGTSTPKSTYTTSAGSVANANPTICDSAGRVSLWLNGSYKITVKDSLDNTIWTSDNVSSQTATGDMVKATYDPANIAQQLVGTGATQILTNKTLTSPTLTTPNITGIINAGNAAAGSVGEYTSSRITSGSAVSLTNNTPANVTSISLTAGDWDVSGAVVFTGGATTQVLGLQGSISATSATLDTTPGSIANMSGQNTTFFNTYLANPVVQIAPIRVNISGTTTYYLVTNAVFTTSTCSAFGKIIARRVR